MATTFGSLPTQAAALAVAAAHATGTAFVGVDLLPTTGRGWVVIELNGAVEFTSEHSEWIDVFSEAAPLLESEVIERGTWLPDSDPSPTMAVADDGLVA